MDFDNDILTRNEMLIDSYVRYVFFFGIHNFISQKSNGRGGYRKLSNVLYDYAILNRKYKFVIKIINREIKIVGNNWKFN